jgi:hypothetical protein
MICAGPTCAGSICAGSICAGPILSVRLIRNAGTKGNEILQGSEPRRRFGTEPVPAESDDVAVPPSAFGYLVLPPFGFHSICRPFCDSVCPGAVFYTGYRSS